jgi:hypothetical protein
MPNLGLPAGTRVLIAEDDKYVNVWIDPILFEI